MSVTTHTTKEEKTAAKIMLDDLGFYSSVVNGMKDHDFGNNSYGLHGAVSICLIHTFKQKFPNNVLDILISSSELDQNTEGCIVLIMAVTKLILHCLRQSDRSLPALNSFKVSFLKAKFTLSATEKYARLFALCLFCKTSFGWNHCMKAKYATEETMTKRIQLIERTISIYQLLYAEKTPLLELSMRKKIIEQYLSLYKSTKECDFEDDNMCQFPKSTI